MTPDRFLADYFRALERRESPACVSVEARTGGTYEAAQHAQATLMWAMGVMGTLERSGRLTRAHVAVLRHFYLALTVEHVALIRMRSPGEKEARTVGVQHLAPGQAPPECAEVQSMVDWSAMAVAVGKHRHTCRRLWHEARAVVREELAGRFEEVDVW